MEYRGNRVWARKGLVAGLFVIGRPYLPFDPGETWEKKSKTHGSTLLVTEWHVWTTYTLTTTQCSSHTCYTNAAQPPPDACICLKSRLDLQLTVVSFFPPTAKQELTGGSDFPSFEAKDVGFQGTVGLDWMTDTH